jgi:hypothetical protein
MKSYIQGLFTGAVFVFAIMVLIGANDNDSESGRYAISTTATNKLTVAETIMDIKTGKVISRKNFKMGNFDTIK